MISLQDAKNRFSAVVDDALAGHPQEVTRRGKPVVMVVAVEEYRRLVQQATERRESFADHLLAFPDADMDTGTDIGAEDRAQVVPRDVDF